MSDHNPHADPNKLDEAIARLQSAMRDTDCEIEAIQYLSGPAEQVKGAIIAVAAEVEAMQSRGLADPPAIANYFEQAIVPILEQALASAQVTPSPDVTLAAIQDLAVQALETDIEAFHKLAEAYRRQDQRLLAAGRELRESSAGLRRQWIEQSLTLGRAVGLYEPEN